MKKNMKKRLLKYSLFSLLLCITLLFSINLKSVKAVETTPLPSDLRNYILEINSVNFTEDNLNLLNSVLNNYYTLDSNNYIYFYDITNDKLYNRIMFNNSILSFVRYYSGNSTISYADLDYSLNYKILFLESLTDVDVISSLSNFGTFISNSHENKKLVSFENSYVYLSPGWLCESDYLRFEVPTNNQFASMRYGVTYFNFLNFRDAAISNLGIGFRTSSTGASNTVYVGINSSTNVALDRAISNIYDLNFKFVDNINADYYDDFYDFIFSYNPIIYGGVWESNYIDIKDSLFNIFTLITGWISSVVLVVVPIMWTGTELTTLGILAVCGLAVSVLLLLIALISRFLKFRG